MTTDPAKYYPMGGGTNWRTLTVTYVREDGRLVLSRNGRGRTHAAALQDADDMLPVGRWRRLTVSSPNTIYGDIKGKRSRRVQRSARLGEGVTVVRDPARPAAAE